MESTLTEMEVLSISPEEAARYIGCSCYKVKEMARQGKIPHYRVGNRIRFTKNGLQEWIAKQEKKNWRQF